MASGRIKHNVTTTMDGVIDYAATVGLSGTSSGLSCSVVFSTEQHTAVSGTSPGIITVTLPAAYAFNRMIAWGADLQSGQTGSLFGQSVYNTAAAVGAQYLMQKRAFQYQSGSDAAANRLPMNPTAGGGATFQFAINQLKVMVTGNVAAGNVTVVSGTLVDPIDQSIATSSPVATISIWAKFRNTSRGR